MKSNSHILRNAVLTIVAAVATATVAVLLLRSQSVHAVTPQIHSEIVMLGQRGEMAVKRSDLVQAHSIYGQVRELYQKGVHDSVMCRILEYGGNVCMLQGRYSEAIGYYQMAIDEAERFSNEKAYGFLANNIGVMYAQFQDYRQANSWFQKSVAVAHKYHNEDLLAINLINMVKSCSRMANVDQARQLLSQLEQNHARQADRDYYLAASRCEIALASHDNGSAVKWATEALRQVSGHKLDSSLRTEPLLNLGKAYVGLRSAKAVGALQRAIALANSNSDPFIRQDAYKLLATCYRQSGRTDSAQAYLSRYVAVNDSILRGEQFNKASNMVHQYQEEQAGRHISLLQGRNREQRQVIVVIAVALALVLALLAMIVIYLRHQRRTNRLLLERNREIMKKSEESQRIIKQLAESKKTPMPQSADDAPGVQLSQDQQIEILNRVNEVIKDVAVISDPDFNLATLAKMVDSNTKYVSMAINDTYGKNFKTFINEFRVQEACKRLADDEHYGNLTIQAIAETVGFRSSKSLTQAFQKFVGMTPSTYKRLNAQQ